MQTFKQGIECVWEVVGRACYLAVLLFRNVYSIGHDLFSLPLGDIRKQKDKQ